QPTREVASFDPGSLRSMAVGGAGAYTYLRLRDRGGQLRAGGGAVPPGHAALASTTDRSGPSLGLCRGDPPADAEVAGGADQGLRCATPDASHSSRLSVG